MTDGVAPILKVVIVGYGVQGRKRHRAAGEDVAAIVDSVEAGTDYRDIREVPLEKYDAAIVCTPDSSKLDILRYLIANGKHAMVEKPLIAKCANDLASLEALARQNGTACYTAYNHRFEPHFIRMRELVHSGALGHLYCCRLLYGNGTANLVRNSPWRDRGAGVLHDLGSHLLDSARFWFGDELHDFHLVSASRFENCAPDHVIVASNRSRPRLELEMSLVSWRNHFSCDLYGEKGSAHIDSLCKWGTSTFTHRMRVLPSGRPVEESVTLLRDDPTWELEYTYFKRLCSDEVPACLGNDIWISRTLERLSAEMDPSTSAQ